MQPLAQLVPGADWPTEKFVLIVERPAVLSAAGSFQSLRQNMVIKHGKLPLILRGSLCLDALEHFSSPFLPSRLPWLHEEGKESDLEAKNQSKCNAAFLH